jgi:hypothetical protein
MPMNELTVTPLHVIPLRNIRRGQSLPDALTINRVSAAGARSPKNPMLVAPFRLCCLRLCACCPVLLVPARMVQPQGTRRKG